MKALGVVAAMVLLAFSGGVAWGDPDDLTPAQKGQALMMTLDQGGVPVADQKTAVLMANAACLSLTSGHPMSAVLLEMSEMNSWTLKQAGYFVGAAAEGYCPEQNPFHE